MPKAIKWCYEIANLLASQDKSFYKKLDNLSKNQKSFLDCFKNELKKNSKLHRAVFLLVVFRHTFYVGNISYRKAEFSKFFDKGTAFYQLCQECIPENILKEYLTIQKRHKQLPATMLQPVQSINYRALVIELNRLTGVKWHRNRKGQEVWIKDNDTVLTDVRTKLKALDIKIKTDRDSCIVLDATKLSLEHLKSLEPGEQGLGILLE